MNFPQEGDVNDKRKFLVPVYMCIYFSTPFIIFFFHPSLFIFVFYTCQSKQTCSLINLFTFVYLGYETGSCRQQLLYGAFFPADILQPGNRNQWAGFHGSTQSTLLQHLGSSPDHLSQNLN